MTALIARCSIGTTWVRNFPQNNDPSRDNPLMVHTSTIKVKFKDQLFAMHQTRDIT